MSNLTLEILTGVSLLAGFMLSCSCFALRDFSRSRLDEICRKRNRPERFGAILKAHETALSAAELFLAATIVILLGLTFSLLSRLDPPSNDLLDPPSNDLVGWTVFLLEVVLIQFVFVSVTLMLPWTLARVRGEAIIERYWPMLRLLTVLAGPYLVVLRKFDGMLHRLAGVEQPQEGNAAAISEEIFSVVEEGQREGVIEDEARTMIRRVMELADVEASSIMTPRTEIVTLPVTATFEEARRLMMEEGHSRVPVIGENTDDIRGILYAKDLLDCTGRDAADFSLEKIVREPMYVPESSGVDRLLELMKTKRVQIAIVLDEYGGVSGLVSMEDVLEEIVGEIDDEYDEIEEEDITVVNERTVVVDGRVHLDDLNDLLDYDLPEEGDYDTIAGFIVSELGRIPDPGDTLVWKQVRITVLDADKRRIVKVELDRDPTLEAIPTEQE